MSTKKSKGLWPKWVITIFTSVCLIATVLVCLWIGKYYYDVAVVPSEIDINVVKERAQRYLDTHGFNKTKIVYMHAYDDEIKATGMQYYYTSTLSKVTRCYVDYIDSETSNVIWWKKNNGIYDLWFSDSRVGYTVKSTIKEEPIYMNPWNILQDLEENYYLFNELVEFDGEQCFLLYTYGTDEEQTSIIGEELYIRASDFAPRAIMSYKQYSASDIDAALKELEDYENIKDYISEDIEIEDLEATVEAMQDYSILYDFTFSTAEIVDYEIPQHYITEEEYVELLKSNGLYTEEVTDEP